jgi:hypothetical protein
VLENRSSRVSHKVGPAVFECHAVAILEEEAAGAEGEGLEAVSSNSECGRGLPREYRNGILDLIAVIYNWRESASISIA